MFAKIQPITTFVWELSIQIHEPRLQTGMSLRTSLSTWPTYRAYIDKALLDNINSTIKSSLERCRGYYEKAVRVLAEAINDLDSETFYELSRLAIASDRAARDCQSTFHGHPPLDLSPMNHNLRILSNICYVVSKLFNVS